MTDIARYFTHTLSAIASLAFILPNPAWAEDDDDFEVSANVAIVSDYRFRGISLSDEDFAIQGGLDVSHSSGVYAGTWGSSISQFNGAEMELDVYGGYSTDVGGFNIDIGALAFLYPGGTNTNYYEIYASTGRDYGRFAWTAGARYSPSQNNIGSQDNIYLYGDLNVPIQGTPLTATGHLGFEDGAFGNNKLDWLLGVSAEVKGLELGIQYIDTDQAGTLADGTILFSIGAAF